MSQPNMSDEELDRNWQPNGRRPQSYVLDVHIPLVHPLTCFTSSTMARSFSAELMDIFRIENSVSDLDSQVDKRSANFGPRMSLVLTKV